MHICTQLQETKCICELNLRPQNLNDAARLLFEVIEREYFNANSMCGFDIYFILFMRMWYGFKVGGERFSLWFREINRFFVDLFSVSVSMRRKWRIQMERRVWIVSVFQHKSIVLDLDLSAFSETSSLHK